MTRLHRTLVSVGCVLALSTGLAVTPSAGGPAAAATTSLATMTAPSVATVAVRSHQAYLSYPGITVLSSLPEVRGKVFLTVDDGAVRLASTAKILRGTEAMLFPVGGQVRKDPAYFRSLAGAGRPIADHTASHLRLAGLPFAAQKHQICRGRDEVTEAVGVAPVVFRPPYGSFDLTTLKAAVACGMTYLLLWDVTVNSGSYQTWGGPIKAGDIVLMHFTPSFASDFRLLRARMAARHLEFGDLRDYLGAGPGATPVRPRT
jgi:peptidoglycan/xylan/chitin deacetylase (PgdA/CDA1 family)